MPRTTQAERLDRIEAAVAALTAAVATMVAAPAAAPAAPVASAPVATTPDDTAAREAARRAARIANGQLCVCGHEHSRPVVSPMRHKLAQYRACQIKPCQNACAIPHAS